MTLGPIQLLKCVRQKKITQERLNEIVGRTRQGGGEVIKLLKTGSAYYAPATSAIEMAESYLYDKKRILPCAAKLKKGQYGVTKPMFVGVPAKIGAKGVEEIIEVPLSQKEMENLQISIQAVDELNQVAINL